MSTVKAVNFQHPSSTAANLTLAADGTVTGGLPAGGRNLLYNGAMQVAQRGTSTAGITTSGYYTADRWNTALLTLGTWTNSIENDAPTGTGLRKSCKWLVTTADASPASSDLAIVIQRLEGQDLQRIAKGTASAQQVTLSFWVKSNVTGSYVVNLQDSDNNRQVAASYAISASATWERKAITFPADTTGQFDNDNGQSLEIYFWLASGSNATSGTLETTWATNTTANRAVGQTNLAAATNNYWQVTGVQLEVGPVASAFEFKPYGQELRECQRYCFKIGPGEAYARVGMGSAPSTTAINVPIRTPVTMRATPTSLTVSGTWERSDGANVADVTPTLGDTVKSPDMVAVNASGTFTQFRPYFMQAKNDTSAYLLFSAEL